MSADDAYRSRAWEAVVHSYGTAAVFGARARRLRLLRNIRDFIGVAVPVVLGFFAAHEAGAYQYLVGYVLGVLALAQLLTVIWSFVSKWDEDYFYARNANSENEDMFQRWERIGKGLDNDIAAAFREAETRDSLIQVRDRAQEITPKEKRYGMRSALLYLQKSCALCQIVPKSMTPTICACCGSF